MEGQVYVTVYLFIYVRPGNKAAVVGRRDMKDTSYSLLVSNTLLPQRFILIPMCPLQSTVLSTKNTIY